MGKRMGLFLNVAQYPSPGRMNRSDHSLPTGVDGDVFDRDLLMALMSMTIECLEEDREGT